MAVARLAEQQKSNNSSSRRLADVNQQRESSYTGEWTWLDGEQSWVWVNVTERPKSAMTSLNQYPIEKACYSHSPPDMELSVYNQKRHQMTFLYRIHHLQSRLRIMATESGVERSLQTFPLHFFRQPQLGKMSMAKRPWAPGPDAPRDIKTEPALSVVFNAPCCFEQMTSVRLTNNGAKKIGWQLKSNNVGRYSVEPADGVLKPGGNILVDVKVRPFFFKADECANDRMTFEWVDVPEGSTGEDTFNSEWLSTAPVVRRHVMSFRYNP